MDVHVVTWSAGGGWQVEHKGTPARAQWVVYFGSRKALAESKAYAHLKAVAPKAVIMGGSTGGEIMGREVNDDSVVAACVTFQNTKVEAFRSSVEGVDSYDLGREINKTFNKAGLRHIFLLTDGLHVNGSGLVRGVVEGLPDSVTVTGGLAGDGADFKTTEVGLGDAPMPKMATAVAFYGDKLRIGYGSLGGWDKFGPERRVTRSAGNVVYELDGKPALSLYKSYLAEEAARLPVSGLMYPLSIRAAEAAPESAVVRTIMAVDEAEQSLTFAGEVPQGYLATLMRGNFDNLVDGAGKAAKLAETGRGNWGLALLVSCIGRKLLLGQNISDETEAVGEALRDLPTVGFYSYGEICHHAFTETCEFHNQTMTVTLLGEDA